MELSTEQQLQMWRLDYAPIQSSTEPTGRDEKQAKIRTPFPGKEYPHHLIFALNSLWTDLIISPARFLL
jgi:hypothetical protein